MASRIWETQVTVPAGTPQATPLVSAWVTEDNLWNVIELIVPPGHNGLTGIRVMKGDVPLLPYNSASFIVANDYTREFPVNDYVPTGDVTIQTFNTGAYPHTFYLRVTISDWDKSGAGPGAVQSQPISTGTITTSPDPLSPDAILGPVTTDQLVNGQLTADQLAGVETENLTVPPAPAPKGL